MKAKKQLGQHFLIDRYAIDRIVSYIQEFCDKHVALVEVGPGQGVLTQQLVQYYPNFKAIELDSDMIDILKLLLGPQQLIHMDFLKADLDAINAGEAFNLVGNFPYNISSQIVFKMLEYKDKIPFMVGMFQRELAQRICASPGSKANGILSLNAQAFYEAELLFDIAPEAFDPPPKVFSSVIVMKRKTNRELGCDAVLYKKVIKQAFQQRRKKMKNTLKSFALPLEDEIFQKRPEELSVEDFVNIVNKIQI